MASQHRKILNLFAFRRIIIPILIGLAVIVYMIMNDLEKGDLRLMRLTWDSVGFFLLAILMVALRDLAYIYRIRLLTNKSLNWGKSFQVIFLWEFASSVTPSVIGGSAIAIYILSKEKLGTGRATATVMVTALLDELFYIFMVPLVFILAGIDRLYVDATGFKLFGTSFTAMGIFLIGYGIVVLITFILTYGVFINPSGIKWLLIRSTKISFLRRFAHAAEETGNQIISASIEFRKKSITFWLRATGATFVSWTARFWVVNFLIIGFTSTQSIGDNMLIYARQLMMWVIMLVSPTPGGSGIAEFFFPIFLREFIAGTDRDLTVIVALAWRLLTYYPYLLIGALILPFWLKRVYLGRKLISFRKK